MRGRLWMALLAAIVLTAACGGGGGDDGAAGTSETSATTEETGTAGAGTGGDPAVRTWDAGAAAVTFDDRRFDLALELCALRSGGPDPDKTTLMLQVEGAATGAETVMFRVVRTETTDPPSRIDVISLRFEDADGTLVRIWEAQRVVDLDTGEVSDLHGDGTTPLLDVQEPGDGLLVTASDAAFWQFDLTGDDDRTVGVADVRASCAAE